MRREDTCELAEGDWCEHVTGGPTMVVVEITRECGKPDYLVCSWWCERREDYRVVALPRHTLRRILRDQEGKG